MKVSKRIPLPDWRARGVRRQQGVHSHYWPFPWLLKADGVR